MSIILAIILALHLRCYPKRRSKIARAVLLVLAACGSNDGAPNDAALDDSGKPIVDAASPQGFVELPVNCQPYSREVRHVATDGTKDVTINYWASFDLHPGDDFIVQACTTPVVPTCSGGDQCMGPTQPAATETCNVLRGSGGFFDGKLGVLCGQRFEHYSSTGVLLTSSQMLFTVRVEAPQ